MPVEGHVTLPSMEAGRACDDGAAAIIFEERRQLRASRPAVGADTDGVAASCASVWRTAAIAVCPRPAAPSAHGARVVGLLELANASCSTGALCAGAGGLSLRCCF